MRSALAILVLGLSLVACSKPGLVGKWKGSAPGGQGESVTEFKGDNTYVSTIHASQQGMSLDITASGTYKADGEKLSMTISDFKIDESKLDAQTKQMMPLIKGALDQQKNKPMDGTFKLEGDKLTITNGGMPGTYDRVK